MSILLAIYLIGIGAFLGIGVFLVLLGGLIGIEPKDSTVLKYLAFTAGWPITYPAWALWVTYQDNK
ncbi:hypothetical protein SEA_CIRCINUS_155 [Streptomyces phage Circinus]|uniref:Uncharacterized protein n=1 Tax=Streptomyces phage Circinus TaxID=2562189 RepID=A0A4D6E192_9CAUD|nr:hypothetical protein SEA_CIRCINUS_155 [Streptomyces phage Circinus]